jgi:NAD(P)-dependent dehydrogenase (short-subunit alcohol dehydrogenase family)
MQNLPGKTAFVTGGASGIGLGIAKALLAAGMNVVIADIRDDHLAEATAELSGGDKVLAIKLDVTDRADFARAADATEAKFGKIHILCNNAGVAVVGPTELATFADWDWVMNVNVGGAINGVTTMLPRILSHGEGGHIVNTCSMSGLVPVGGTTIYSTGKAALVTMMECMRPELEARGVICSAFCPGAVQSRMPEKPGQLNSPKLAMQRPINGAKLAEISLISTRQKRKWGSVCCGASWMMNSTSSRTVNFCPGSQTGPMP